MELILISSNKLKVMLDLDEARKYKILDVEGNIANGGTNGLHEILDDIYRLSGFDTKSENLEIEIFESRDGGCEMFITRQTEKKTYSQKDIKNLCRECLSENVTLAYIFKTMSDLITVCRLLGEKTLPAKSRAFSVGSKNFYLILTFLGFFTSELYTSLEFISEYGERVSATHLEDYLHEYGKEICDKEAVERLSTF